jgi:hypothetical protein
MDLGHVGEALVERCAVVIARYSRLYTSSKSVLKLATIRVYDACFSLRMPWYSTTGMTAYGVVRQLSGRGIRGSPGAIGAAVDWARAASHRQGDERH